MADAALTVVDAEFDPAPASYAMTAITPMAMLSQLAASGASTELVEKYMGLHERWEANQARKAFNEAFAAFKAEAITVERNRKVTDGPLKGRSYAELVSFVEAATPALSKHGLSASWFVSKDERDWIEVTCTVEHVLGGSKSVSLGGPPDAGGAKNALQARISTVTYLERATLKAACGLAEQGDDNDGRSDPGPPKTVSDRDEDRIKALIVETKSDIGKFLETFKVESIADLPVKDFPRALAMLETKKAQQARASHNEGVRP